MIRTHSLGFPRIGSKRQLKKVIESYWNCGATEQDVERVAREIRRENWDLQAHRDITGIPSNDHSLYDHILDHAVLFGAMPERFGTFTNDTYLTRYFELARGGCCQHESALEMTKWWDTNYHYMVPELAADQEFYLTSQRPLDHYVEALRLGIVTTPVLVGPVTFLLLSKAEGGLDNSTNLRHIDALSQCYFELLWKLAECGVEWVQIDEPVLATPLSSIAKTCIDRFYRQLSQRVSSVKVFLATYFGSLGENLDLVKQLPVKAVHVDYTRAPNDGQRLAQELPGSVSLSVGIVDGRNVWRNDLTASRAVLNDLAAKVGTERLIVSTSCSLLHVPLSLEGEFPEDPTLRSWLAFANEKLLELRLLADAVDGRAAEDYFAKSDAIRASRMTSPRLKNPAVRDRVATIDDDQLSRSAPFAERAEEQRERLKLPLFPTTTIGSLPQTAEIRSARARLKKGELSRADYDRFIHTELQACIAVQEELDLDVLVTGEPERTDMVEFFGEQLAGFAFSKNGWVQSFGTRCVKPPIIYGDVSRPRPMTVDLTVAAQWLTHRPVKGMLTGPVTILNWSFVRDDLSRKDVCMQVALAVRDEVEDLDHAGIAIIQIDEPALREGLPLDPQLKAEYLRWSVDAFKLATSCVRSDTQIHTHMCYCEFGDVMEAIERMDADVISLEASRSGMSLLQCFEQRQYPNDLGPGVWDIHSPRVPSADEMEHLLRRAAAVIDPKKLWVNPDCGLKTRTWSQVRLALEGMVKAARSLRAAHGA